MTRRIAPAVAYGIAVTLVALVAVAIVPPALGVLFDLIANWRYVPGLLALVGLAVVVIVGTLWVEGRES